MHRDEVTIGNPCDASFEEMDGDERRRHCAACDKQVHNLSAMTEAEAKQLLQKRHRDGLCVRYRYDPEDGTVQFRDAGAAGGAPVRSGQLESQRSGLRRLLGAAAVALPLLLGGCDVFEADPVDEPQPRAEAPAPTGGPSAEEPTDASPQGELTMQQVVAAATSGLESVGAAASPWADELVDSVPEEQPEENSEVRAELTEEGSESEGGADGGQDEQSDDRRDAPEPAPGPVVMGDFVPAEEKPEIELERDPFDR